MAFLRPLWEILVLARTPGTGITLNCDECFVVMEYLSASPLAEAELERVRGLIQEHLQHCPDCREHHEKKLKELEQYWRQSRSEQTTKREA